LEAASANLKAKSLSLCGDVTDLRQLTNFGDFSSWLLGGRLVVFDFAVGDVAIYNHSAAVVWLSLLDGPMENAQLIEILSQVFEISSDQARSDLKWCLTEWVMKGWLCTNGRDEFEFSTGSCLLNKDSTKVAQPAAIIAPPISFHSITCQLFQASLTLEFALTTSPKDSGLIARLLTIIHGFPLCQEPVKQKHSTLLKISETGHEIIIAKNNDPPIVYQDKLKAYSDVIQHIFHLSYPEFVQFGVLHAAALGKQKTIIFAGISGSGKSTLSAYLARQGWHYYGDDTIGLGATDDQANTAVVLPFPTSISIKEGSLETLASCYPELIAIEPVDYNNKTARFLSLPEPKPVCKSLSLEISALVFPTFLKNATINTEQVTPIDALSLLMHSGGVSFDTDITPSKMHQLFATISCLPIYKLTYSNLPDAEAWLDTLLTK